MIKKSLLALALIPLALIIVSLQSSAVHAANNNNNLIDDRVFDNTGSMSAVQIDVWLNGFSGSCISQNSGFSAPDPIGYSPNYPFTDGKYIYGSPVSAGQVIYDAAHGHGLNPQVLLTKLQNEEQLVDGTAGCGSNWRYASAVGYACTDSDTFSHNYSYTGADPFADGSALPTPLYYRNNLPVNSISGTCVNHNVFAGFSEQVVHAAWALSIWQHKSEGQTDWAAINGGWNHCDDNNTCPPSMNIPSGWACYGGFMTQGTFKRCPTDQNGVFYDGFATIDGSSVHMDDGATAALYVYTPHFQSFTTIFQSWFGSPYQLYTWDIISQFAYTDSSQSTPVSLGNLGPGQRYYIGFSLKNTGNVTWTKDGSNPMNLGTASPRDRNSPFCDTSWLNGAPACNRSASLNEWTVAPGQIGSFGFWITTPSAPGSYNEIYAPVVEGITWMDSHTVSFPMIVNPASYTWSPYSQNVFTDDSKQKPVDYSHLVANQHYYVVINVKNTGNMLWQKLGPTPTELGSSNPTGGDPIDRNSAFCDSTWLSCSRAASLNEYSVAPGQIGSFGFWIKAPAGGSYSETFTPLVESVTWMNNPPALIAGSVAPAFYSWSLINQFAYTDSSKTAPVNMAQLVAGQRYYIGLTLKNTGTAIWHRGTSNPFDLGSVGNSASDVDRTSAYCDTSWLNGAPACNRSASLNEWTVAPGQIGSFGFWITTPSAGTYSSEYFAPVMEGLSWLNDHRALFPATVH